MWPAEGKWVAEEFCGDVSRLSIIESLRAGVTCINDMYFFPDTTGQVSDKSNQYPKEFHHQKFRKNQIKFENMRNLIFPLFLNFLRIFFF